MREGLLVIIEALLVSAGILVMSGIESSLWCFPAGGALVLAALMMEWKRTL